MRSIENSAIPGMGIRTKMLLFWGGGVAAILVAVSLLPLFGIPFTEVQGTYQHHRNEIIRKIDSIAALKKEELQRWFLEQINHARVFSETANFNVSAELFKTGLSRNLERDTILARISTGGEYKNIMLIASSFLDVYSGDNEIRIVDIQTGIVIFSTKTENLGLSLSGHEAIHNAGVPGIRQQVFFSKGEATAREHLNIIYPVVDRVQADESPPAQLVMFILDTEEVLSPILHESQVYEQSMETLLIDMNRVLLSPLKYPLPGNKKPQVLVDTLTTKPAELAAWGIDGTIFSNDYRGVPVIASIRHMRITPELGIGLIIKIDEKEVMAFSRKSLITTLIISGAGLLFMLLLVYFLSERITRPIIQLSRTVKAIMEGRLDERSCVKTRDEVGLLARSFNVMVDRIQQWHDELETKVMERTALLSESETRLRMTLEATRIGIWDWDMCNDVWYSTPIYFEMLGYEKTAEEQNRDFWGECIYPDDRGFVVNKMVEVRDKGLTEFDIEFRFRHADGSYRWLNSIGHGVKFDENGKSIRMLGLQIDITRRKQSEEKLHKSEELFSSAFHASPAGIIMTRIADGKIVNANKAFFSMFEFSREEVIGHTSIELNMFTPEVRSRLIQKQLESEGLQNFELLSRSKSGRPIHLLFSSKPLELEGDACHITTLIDITERKRAEEELHRYRNHLEELVKERTRSLEENQKALMNVVEDLNDKTCELKSANEKLQDLDRLKNIFLASMSHELRTPLNSIIGFTGILLMGLTGKLNKEQENQLGMVKNSAHHLLGLINDILDISKVEAGMMEPLPEEFGFEDLIQETIASVLVTAQGKGLDFSYEGPSDLVLFSDQKRIRQIIINLLSNAVKFTEQGLINVLAQSVTQDQKAFIRVSVTDTGIGIRKEDMSRLFFPFQQVDASLVKKHEGTGLGLYLSKKLANMLGGDIMVNSEYGKGSKFIVELPLRMDKKDIL